MRLRYWAASVLSVMAGMQTCLASSDVYETADKIAPCDATGHRTGPWEYIHASTEPHVQAPSWIPAFDNESTDLSVLSGNAQFFTNIWGTLAAGTRTAFDINATGMVTAAGVKHYFAPFMINDVHIASGAWGCCWLPFGDQSTLESSRYVSGGDRRRAENHCVL